ncbi:NADH-quinone oxidoreductase subunit N [Adhaeribacter radiodurans]|uniref:NADH-quinone oxidoreductase subunit N n=1 Tax=Adhaeribacter radiodurans TaxID=2745197 RepID=A0A7L7L7H5_9BACT|nr:NADH-quinone oxidoreductase subunit N [Adhaeribacter radiodurans]QMU28704.1 NADH-quinone oxidoreductase subunit N [Adhaeribacter radiodurans]
MRLNDLNYLMPLLVLVGAATLNMLVIAVKRNHKVIYGITLVAHIIALTTLLFLGNHPYTIDPFFIIDGWGIFNLGLILVTSLFVTMLSYAYFEQREERREEYYILLILATLGSCVLVISQHFMALFLGLEVLSVALYSLIAYLRTREHSDEAGIKYLILAAMSSAFLLFGMALIYADSGTMAFASIAAHLKALPELPPLLLTGFGLMVVGIGFKLGVVPFHMWAPDVYEGAPAPVTAFIATVSKGGMIALLIRFFAQVDGYRYPNLMLVFTIIAIASMLAGNLLALRQRNVKRLLAYSSIAHLGYILVAFLAGNQLGVEAVSFYLVAYFITSLGAFGVVALLSDTRRDADRLRDYRGLFWRRPATAAIFTAMLLSLAGIPLTAGFVGKFYILASGVNAQRWLLVIMLILNSVIGLYYYIKVIAAMFAQTQSSQKKTRKVLHPAISFATGATMAILALLLVYIGIYPTTLVQLLKGLLTTIVTTQ